MLDIYQALLNKIVECLVAILRPECVYPFGSHAYREPHKYNDLDFLVVVPDDAEGADELAITGRRALLDCPVAVDILVYHRSEMDKWAPVRFSLPYTVVHKGRQLYAA